jgi:hypothetical protein
MFEWFETDANRIGHEIPNCGTAACIAGWAETLMKFDTRKKSKKRARPSEMESISSVLLAEKLGFDVYMNNRLFYVRSWPQQFQSKIPSASKTNCVDIGRRFDSLPPEIRAKIAAERIDHFLATDGKE